MPRTPAALRYTASASREMLREVPHSPAERLSFQAVRGEQDQRGPKYQF